MMRLDFAFQITPGLGILSVILTLIYVKDPPRGEAEGGASLQASTLSNDLRQLCKTLVDIIICCIVFKTFKMHFSIFVVFCSANKRFL